MENSKIKSIDTVLENNINKTKLIISDNVSEKEILLEGKGSLKIPVEA